jgi:glyoxylase-like metal-dependent hydrolase (beta-lactamase superfamily II)
MQDRAQADTGAGVSFSFAEAPAPGRVTEVAEGVLWMRLPMRMRPDHVNVYALDEGDAWTLVDTGVSSDGIRGVWESLLAGPLAGKPVARVIVTHHHPDHIGNAGWFRIRHGAELWTSRTAWLFARMLTLDRQDTPPPELLDFWHAAGMEADVYAERSAARPMNFAEVVAPLPLGFRQIGDGEVIVAGGRRWRAAFGQGHAPDQVTLWGVGHDLVLAGDQILPGITPNLGVYATEPGADSVGPWLASCRRLLGLAGPGQLGLPGHRRPFRGLDARLAELIRHQEQALERLADHLAAPRTASQCFEILYGRRIGRAEYTLALGEALGHLNHLERQGRAARETARDGRWWWRGL